MNNSQHIADVDLALYAMGALPSEEADPIKAHLDQCAVCREELRRDTLTLAAYAQTTPEVKLPENARNRFMARVSTTAQTQTSRPVTQIAPVKEQSSWRTLFGAGGARWSPLLAGGFALALLFVGIDDLKTHSEIEPLLRQARRGAVDSVQLAQIMDLLNSPQAKKVALHPGPVAAPPPEGRVVYSAGTGKLLLTASNLHPLPAGKVYELWILQPNGQKPLPAGTFTPDSKGYATMMQASAPQGLNVQGFGVTIENSGGSETPTLPIVLSGL